MDREAAIRSVVDGRAWEEFCDALRASARVVLDAAPDDAFDRAEGLRYVGRLATWALHSFLEESDPAHPRLSASTPKIGGDNPDYGEGWYNVWRDRFNESHAAQIQTQIDQVLQRYYP